MGRTASLLLVFFLGCAGTPEAVRSKPLIPEKHWAEAVTALPDDPEKLAAPKELGLAESVEPIEEGEPAPFSGLIVSEARAWRDAQFRIAYKAIRDLDKADRHVWVVQREFYETNALEAEREIARLQPTWWDRHGSLVIGGASFVAGALVTIGIAAAIEQVHD